MITTAVKERPILFSGPMVRAILDGRKTQTRRIISRSNCSFGSASREFWNHCDFDAPSCFADRGYLHVPCHCQGDSGFEVTEMDCEHCKEVGWEGTRHRLYPKWEPGDRLWVREAWSFYEDAQLFDCIRYRVDGAVRKPEFDKFPDVSENAWHTFEMRCDGVGCADHRWRPSIYMPRWASRITLEITEVRVQRLQEISEEDAIAEGAQCAGFPAALTNYGAFGRLWQKINGPDSWSANPFVWAISFKRI